LERLLLEGVNTGEEISLSPDFWIKIREDAAKILTEHHESRSTRTPLIR
jgi:hypothetical protein